MLFLQTESVSDACMAGTFHSYGWVALVITIAGLAAAIYSLAAGFRWFREETERNEKSSKRHASKSWLLGLWVLVPPAWLYVEAIFLFRLFGKAECFGQFRYAQELVSRGWIVLVAVLGFLYFGREIAGRE